jgi:hypothetical protein
MRSVTVAAFTARAIAFFAGHGSRSSPQWLHHYNNERNHSSFSNRPPITRVRNDPTQDG